MSSIIDSNMNTTSSTDGKYHKYHIVLIYLVHENGYCGGDYHEPSSALMGTIGGELRENMLDEAYESLEECMEDKDYIPFDIQNS
ncbi:unnamed protein product [Rotaria sp. Silwood1]|nr:unnamed protein product [Rotaria sp. Silwood1]